MVVSIQSSYSQSLQKPKEQPRIPQKAVIQPQPRTQSSQIETITSGGTQLVNSGGNQQDNIQYMDTQSQITKARTTGTTSGGTSSTNQIKLDTSKYGTEQAKDTTVVTRTTGQVEYYKEGKLKAIDTPTSQGTQQVIMRDDVNLTSKRFSGTSNVDIGLPQKQSSSSQPVQQEVKPTVAVEDIQRQQSRLANPLEEAVLKQRQTQYSQASMLESKPITLEEARKTKGVTKIYYEPGEKVGQEKVLSLDIKKVETKSKGTSTIGIDTKEKVISEKEIKQQSTKERIFESAKEIVFPTKTSEKILPPVIRVPFQMSELGLSELEKSKTFGDFFKFQAGKPITEAQSETKYVIGVVGTLATFSDIEDFISLRKMIKPSDVKILQGEGTSTQTLKGEKVNTILEKGTIKDLPYERRIIQQDGSTTELIKYENKIYKIETFKGETTSKLRVLELTRDEKFGIITGKELKVPEVIESKRISIPETQSELKLSLDPLKKVSGSTTETLIVSPKTTSSDILYTEIQSQKEIGKLTKQDVITIREQPNLLKGIEGKADTVKLKQNEDMVLLGINQPSVKPQQFNIEISSKQRAEVLGSITDIRTTRLQQVEKAQFGVTELNKPEIVLGEGVNLKEVSVELKPIEKKIISEEFTLELKGTEAKVIKPSEEFLVGQKSSVSEFKFATREEKIPYAKWEEVYKKEGIKSDLLVEEFFKAKSKGLSNEEALLLSKKEANKLFKQSEKIELIKGTESEFNKLDILNTPKVKEIIKEEEQIKKNKPIFDTNIKSNIKDTKQIALTEEILSEIKPKQTYYLNPKSYIDSINFNKADVSYFGVRTDIFTKEVSLPKLIISSPEFKKEKDIIIQSKEIKKEFIFLPVSESKIKPITLTESISKPKQESRLNLDTLQKPIQRLNINTVQKQDLAIKQEQKQEQVLENKQENIFKQKQETKQVLRQPQLPRFEMFKPIETQLPKPIIKIPSVSSQSKGLFSVEVGKSGNKYEFSRTNLSIEEAKSFAREKVRGSAAASFKITPQSEKGRMELSQAQQELSKEFGRSKKDEGRFIQKTSERISSAGEKAQITQKGLSAIKQKKTKKKGLML